MNISDLRQEISILREERVKAENRLMGAKDMLASSLILRKVICGNPNCRCQEGKLHGPYPNLFSVLLVTISSLICPKLDKLTSMGFFFSLKISFHLSLGLLLFWGGFTRKRGRSIMPALFIRRSTSRQAAWQVSPEYPHKTIL